MSSTTDFIASIEALLTAAKTYDVKNPDRLKRLQMLSMVDALHYELEDPAEAMFRQLTNVRAQDFYYQISRFAYASLA